MKLQQKLIYFFLIMLISNISMASGVSNLLVPSPPCQMMMPEISSSTVKNSHGDHQMATVDMLLMKDMSKMGMEMDNCCSGSDCPMTSCASPTLQSTPSNTSETIQMTHLVQVLYQDLPLFLIISPHYRPPIQTLS